MIPIMTGLLLEPSKQLRIDCDHMSTALERTAEVFRERTFSFGSQIRKERSMLTSKELATAHAQNMEKIHVR